MAKKTREVELEVTKIEHRIKRRGENIINTLIIKFNKGLQFRKNYLGIKEDPLLKLNIGDSVIATVTRDNRVIDVKLLRN